MKYSFFLFFLFTVIACSKTNSIKTPSPDPVPGNPPAPGNPPPGSVPLPSWRSTTGNFSLSAPQYIELSSTSYQYKNTPISAFLLKDLNHDQLDDIVFLNPDTQSVDIVFSKPNQQFEVVSLVPSFAPLVSVPFNGEDILRLADLNGDDRLDIVLIFGNKYLASAIAKPDGSFDFLNFVLSIDLGQDKLTDIALKDINGDQKTDLLFSHQTTDIYGQSSGPGPILWLAGLGDGNFNSACSGEPYCLLPSSNKGSGVLDLLIKDLNHDQKEDILYTVYGEGTYVMLSRDGIVFDTPQKIEGRDGPFLGLADFNKDSELDLIMLSDPYKQRMVSISLGQANASFGSPLAIQTGFFENSRTLNEIFAIADFDGDSNLDICILNHHAPASLIFLFGKGDGTFKPSSLFLLPSQTHAIGVGDMNADHKPDIIVEIKSSAADTKRKIAVFLNQTE